MHTTQSQLTIERNVPYTPRGSKINGLLKQLAGMKVGESFQVPAYDATRFYSLFSRLRRESAFRANNRVFVGHRYIEGDANDPENYRIRFWRIG